MDTAVPPLPPPSLRAVRPLAPEDGLALNVFCARRPGRFRSPRMNFEAHGLGNTNLRAWGAFGPDGTMAGLMLRFTNTLVAADIDGGCAAAFAPIIDAEPNLAGVRGTLEVTRALSTALSRYTVTGWEDSYYLELRRPPHCPPEQIALARRAVPDDLEALADLYAGAGAMYRSRPNVAAKLNERVYVVEDSGHGTARPRLAACALLNVEGSDAALIGGVYTRPECRGRGYASACTAALALDIRRDGKLPCLFYENPVAGRAYHRLGFEQADHWAVLYLALRGRSFKKRD